MWLLILGWVLFLGAHLSPGVFGMRDRLIGTLGEGRFLGVYIATSVTGVVCIIAAGHQFFHRQNITDDIVAFALPPGLTDAD